MSHGPAGGRATTGWVVGRVAGAPLVISRGWALSTLVLVPLLAPAFGPVAAGAAGYLAAAVGVLLLLGSTILHEVAHALVARSRGARVTEVSVTLLGGHTRLAAGTSTPAGSGLIALAGPAVTLALGAGAYAAWLALPERGVLTLVLFWLAIANGFVGLLNLLPGLPLDGGRVVEAVVWALSGDRPTGTVTAGWLGRVLAVVVVVGALAWSVRDGGRPDLLLVAWSAMVGALLWSGASAAIASARSERAVGRLVLRAVMAPARALPVTDLVADLDVAVRREAGPGTGPRREAGPGTGAQLDAGPQPGTGPQRDVVLLAADGRPIGYVDREAAAAVPPDLRRSTMLGAVAIPLPAGAVVDGDLTGAEAVAAVAAVSRGASVMAVLGRDQEVIGLLRATDVIRALHPDAAGPVGRRRDRVPPGNPPRLPRRDQRPAQQ